MRKPHPLAAVFFWLVAILVSCATLLGDGQGGGSVNRFGESGDMVYQVTQVGNVVCFDLPACEPVYIVITATQSTAWTQTPLPSATVSPTYTPTASPAPMATRTATIGYTPTMVTPDGTYITPIGSGAKCDVEPFAEIAKGQYTYTDSANYGIPQNVRSRPGTNFPIVATLQKNTPVQVYWIKWTSGVLWVSITRDCHNWVSSRLGILDLD